MNKDIKHEMRLREQLPLKLLAANALVTSIEIEDDFEPLSTQEILALGQLPPDAPSSTELIDEDRGAY
jgi:hypothetical protein